MPPAGRHGTSQLARKAEDSPVPVPPELAAQCFNRVEQYQPLYGLSGMDEALRSCRDRALAIEAALAPHGPEFRLIDFGSSLGYFPFFFADRGATTVGLDINPENTAVAVATREVNGLASASFGTASLDIETVQLIPPGRFDVALALSVLHHVIHRRGLDYVSQLVAELLARVPKLVLELAHRDEDVAFAWRTSLPDDPLAVLSACGDVKVLELGRFSSHLSGSTRPMYLVGR